MSLKCANCGHVNGISIIDFDITNVNGDLEQLYLFQCDKCRMFSVVSWLDRWYAGDTWHYAHPPYTEDEARIIFLFFVGCRGSKRCDCEIHQAVSEWVFPARVSIFDRKDLIKKLKSNEKYTEWINDWNEVIFE